MDNLHESLNNNNYLLKGKPVHYFDVVPSTNLIAKQAAERGAPEGTIIICEEQSSGRGRLNRGWTCPYGKGLLMSILLRPKVKAAFLPQLTLVTAVAVCQAVANLTSINAGIKWPNDVLVKGAKICGILAEGKLNKNMVDYAVIGIGINANLTDDDFPADLRDFATSILLQTGKPLPRFDLLNELIPVFDHHYHLFLQEGFAYVKDSWLSYEITLGRTVRMSTTGAVIKGIAMGINEYGGLLVRLEDGSIEEFIAGDVTIGTKQFGHP